jgi:hypothetical protein
MQGRGFQDTQPGNGEIACAPMYIAGTFTGSGDYICPTCAGVKREIVKKKFLAGLNDGLPD